MHAPVLSTDAQASGPCWHLGVASTMGEVAWTSANNRGLSPDRNDRPCDWWDTGIGVEVEWKVNAWALRLIPLEPDLRFRTLHLCYQLL